MSVKILIELKKPNAPNVSPPEGTNEKAPNAVNPDGVKENAEGVNENAPNAPKALNVAGAGLHTHRPAQLIVPAHPSAPVQSISALALHGAAVGATVAVGAGVVVTVGAGVVVTVGAGVVVGAAGQSQ